MSGLSHTGRVGKFRVSAEFIIQALGLPPDTNILYAWVDKLNNTIEFSASHPSMDKVEEGALIPFYQAVVEVRAAHFERVR